MIELVDPIWLGSQPITMRTGAPKASPAGVTKEYTYSDAGQRITLYDGAATTKFIYDEMFAFGEPKFSDRRSARRRPETVAASSVFEELYPLLLETDVAGNLQAWYTNYPGIWGGLASQRQGQNSTFYGLDSQHSGRILTSGAGVVSDEYSWTAFGEPIQTGSGTTNHYGYIALFLYYVDEDGQVTVGPRILVPVDGRFMPRDSIGFGCGHVNVYVYVGNEPMGRVDPSGLIQVSPNCKQCGASGDQRYDYLNKAASAMCGKVLPSLSDSDWNGILACANAKYQGGSKKTIQPPKLGIGELDPEGIKDMRKCLNAFCGPEAPDSAHMVNCATSDAPVLPHAVNPGQNKGNAGYAEPRGFGPPPKYGGSIFLCVDRWLPCNDKSPGGMDTPLPTTTNMYGVNCSQFNVQDSIIMAMIHEMVHGCGIIPPANTTGRPKGNPPFERLTQAITCCIMEAAARHTAITE